MKIIILSVVAIIIAFGAVFLFTNTSKAPSTTSEVNEGQTQSSESVTQEDATTLEAETDIRVDVTETQEQSADPVASKPEPVVQAEAEAEVKKPAPAVAQSKEFTIDAFSFGFSEFELQVNVGDTVTINLTNSDGYHDWVLDEFGASTKQIQSGETTTVTFVATKKGSFEYYCSVGEHRAYGMVGTLVVR